MRTTIGAAKRLAVRQRIVPQSLICSRAGLGVLAELDFRHRHQPGERHADGAADDALFRQAGVEHALGADTCPAGRASRACTPPLGPTSSPNTTHARVDRQLVVERAADRRDHVDARRLRGAASSVAAGGVIAARCADRPSRCSARGFAEHVAGDGCGIGDRAAPRGLRGRASTSARGLGCGDRAHSASLISAGTR